MPSRLRWLVALATITAVCGGCALFGFGPVADEAQRAGGATRLERVTIADDRRSVRLEFIGGAEFDADNLCTMAYEASVEVVDGELEVGVFALEHPKRQQGDFCTLGGYPRELTVELPEPYHGASVRDVTGPVLGLEPP